MRRGGATALLLLAKALRLRGFLNGRSSIWLRFALVRRAPTKGSLTCLARCDGLLQRRPIADSRNPFWFLGADFVSGLTFSQLHLPYQPSQAETMEQSYTHAHTHTHMYVCTYSSVYLMRNSCLSVRTYVFMSGFTRACLAGPVHDITVTLM